MYLTDTIDVLKLRFLYKKFFVCPENYLTDTIDVLKHLVDKHKLHLPLHLTDTIDVLKLFS